MGVDKVIWRRRVTRGRHPEADFTVESLAVGARSREADTHWITSGGMTRSLPDSAMFTSGYDDCSGWWTSSGGATGSFLRTTWRDLGCLCLEDDSSKSEECLSDHWVGLSTGWSSRVKPVSVPFGRGSKAAIRWLDPTAPVTAKREPATVIRCRDWRRCGRLTRSVSQERGLVLFVDTDVLSLRPVPAVYLCPDSSPPLPHDASRPGLVETRYKPLRHRRRPPPASAAVRRCLDQRRCPSRR